MSTFRERLGAGSSSSDPSVSFKDAAARFLGLFGGASSSEYPP